MSKITGEVMVKVDHKKLERVKEMFPTLRMMSRAVGVSDGYFQNVRVRGICARSVIDKIEHITGVNIAYEEPRIDVDRIKSITAEKPITAQMPSATLVAKLDELIEINRRLLKCWEGEK